MTNLAPVYSIESVGYILDVENCSIGVSTSVSNYRINIQGTTQPLHCGFHSLFDLASRNLIIRKAFAQGVGHSPSIL